jgi:branched-chain amino acid transport system ATP-binding protein
VTVGSPACVEGAAPLLTLHGVTRRFGGVVAVKDVSFDVCRAEIVGLIGPNGAGKTTVVNLITGFLKLNAGRIMLGDVELTRKPPHQVSRAGVVRTFQTPKLFRELTVLENVRVGGHQSMTSLRGRTTLRDEVEAAEALLDRFGLMSYARRRAGYLPHALQRRIEIARAVASKPSILLLDEPMAGLTEHETEVLTEGLRSMRDEAVAILLVEHHVSIVMNLCDRVNVLNFGELIASGTPAVVRSNPLVIASYLGDT